MKNTNNFSDCVGGAVPYIQIKLLRKVGIAHHTSKLKTIKIKNNENCYLER